MRENLETSEIEIGELEFDPSNGDVLRLPFRIAEDCTLTFNLVDTTGESQFLKKFELKNTSDSIEIPVPGLSSGAYHAWITIKGRTFIRAVEVKGNRIFNRLKKIFQ